MKGNGADQGLLRFRCASATLSNGLSAEDTETQVAIYANVLLKVKK